MPRYIDADALIAFITKGLNNPDKAKAFGYDAIEILTEVEYATTADVVPKSDVEKQKLEIWRLKGEVERLEKENEKLTINAREIFGEITDSIMFAYKNDIIKYTSLLYFTSKLAELKKKYTEGEL